jgi:hypothetical protein
MSKHFLLHPRERLRILHSRSAVCKRYSRTHLVVILLPVMFLREALCIGVEQDLSIVARHVWVGMAWWQAANCGTVLGAVG